MRYSKIMAKVDVGALHDSILYRPQELVDQAERSFHKKIMAVCDDTLKNDCHLIMITGPSASGKTTTAKKIVAELEERGHKVTRISLDNFYKNRDSLPFWSDGYKNCESIESMDLLLFEQVIGTLLTKGFAHLPVYDFSTGNRAERTIPVSCDDDTYLVIEGIHAINPELSRCISQFPSLSVYISVHSDFIDPQGNILLHARDLRLMRRILRDQVHRHTSVMETLKMWDYVLKGEELYMQPYRGFADFHINSTHVYEPFLYRDNLLKAFDNPEIFSAYPQTAQRLCSAAENFATLSQQLVPPSSLIQEFL
ncbi:uridine kinase family protein [Youxingia wuxianensis]|uniref:Phosphoribulokinase/uridine kinase domain-containing protein n=1 Tax=Youxingia wuxianensis TaxID=2763678 RepID=A0A926ICG0_9FIRM|nr:hypothetical protein [Youxingia wuxianensis]MBC8585162.1 hypothetical protein [Youxingia wuxianensis]